MKDSAQRLSWALEICVKAGMRLTPIRRMILEFLSEQRVPVSLETVVQADGIRDSCNAATAYRTLMLLLELEVIRQVSLPNRISYFVLNMPGESSHFLICRCCGTATELPALQSIMALEQDATVGLGYSRLYHELILFGTCPACQKHPPDVVCVKVQPRMRANTRVRFGRAQSGA